MSNPTALASRDVPVMLSTDDITYKKVVCKKAWNLSIDPQIVEEDSDCGPLIAPGTVKWSVDMEFIMNLTPNGSTEISANEVAGYANNGTTVYIKLLYPDPGGTSFYRQGSGLITNYKENAPVNGLVSATCTFKGSGTLDLSA